LTEATIISQTTAWIKSVVVGCNFCPFAAKALFAKSIRYKVLHDANKENAIETLILEMEFLNSATDIETTLIIMPYRFDDFSKYLDLVRSAETTVTRQGYSGVYQIASFHPEYFFADTDSNDPANYTNRSPYSMLHILREESISHALLHYTDPFGIPEKNIAFAQQKGLRYMELLRATCMKEET